MKQFAFDVIEDRVSAARKALVGVGAAGLISFALVGGAAAQDTAASGNGGTSTADASGGPITIGTIDDEDEAEDEDAFTIEGLDTLGDDIAAAVMAAIAGEDEVEVEDEAGMEDVGETDDSGADSPSDITVG